MHPQVTTKSNTISRMLKSSELKHPEVYFLISFPTVEIGSSQIETFKKYRVKFINVDDLWKENTAKKNLKVEQNESRDDMTAKLIQAKINKLGNRKYIIEGFPHSLKQFETYLKFAHKSVEIKGIAHLVSKHTDLQDPNSSSAQDFRALLQSANERALLRELPYFAQTQKMTSVLLEFFNKESINIPPLIPVICILGGPGSGKGTNSANLVRDYGFRHISTGDLLRGYTEGQMYDVIHKLMTEGKLVPSDILLEIVKEEIDRYNYEGVYLLDGFPRNKENMDVWAKVMHGFASIELFLYLECDEKTMEYRLLGRGADSGRCDDKPEIIKKRFRTFEEMTVPFIKQILKQEQEKVITVDSRQSPEVVYANIQQEFSEIGINPIIKTKEKPSVIFILGGPGSGKGTNCEILTKQYGFKHLSTGDLLRDEIKNKGPQATSIQSYIAEGKLVPSTVLVKLMRNKIQNEGWTGHYLVDGITFHSYFQYVIFINNNAIGFPRSVENIKAWYQIMNEDVHVDSLLYFDCSIQTMEKRLLKRGETSGRSDDNPETIKKRFATFKSQTEPFLEFYKKSGGKIHWINTDQPLETVTSVIKQELIKQKLIPQE